MIGRAHGRSTSKDRAELAREAESTLCVLLEECRLRCEQLSETGYTSPTLRTVHRNLGLAGYHASAGLSRADRQESLAVAIGRAGELTGSIRQAELTLGRQAERAARMVRRAARGRADVDHLNIAQKHLTGARRSLRAPILPSSAERHFARRATAAVSPT